MAKVLDRLMAACGYERRSTSSDPEQWMIDWVTGGSESATGVKVTATSALQYTPFWAAVRVVSGTLAALPFKTYERVEDGGKRPLPKHGVYRLLHDRPNEYMDAVTFLETRQAHVLCYGNGYAEIERNGSGRAIALWPLLPDKTERKLTVDGVPYYEVRVDNQTVQLPDANVLHIKGLGFDGYTGYDVVQYHKEALGYGIGVKEFGASFFGNGASPGGVLEHPNTLSEKALKHLAESWERNHQGLSKAHRLQILEEGMKWQGTSVDPQKAQALEVQKWTVDDCARIFQIPPHKLGSMEYSKYANVYELNNDFYCSTMLYWFRKWESEVNYKLFLPSEQGRLFAEILVDALLRGNMEARTAYYTAGRQWGFLSINDIRGKENMNPIGPAGDIYLNPLNMVPAGTNPEDFKSDGPARNAHRTLLASQWRRIMTKQENANGQRSGTDWWERHRIWAGAILQNAIMAYATVRGVDRAAALGAMQRTIERFVDPAVSLAKFRPEWLADELMNEIGGSCAE